LPIYDGVVTLDESDVPVDVELGDDRVRLSASGTEIGLWPSDECHIAHVTDTIYTITAEDETLQFVPNQPSLFAAAVNGNDRLTAPAPRVTETSAELEAPATASPEAPPPRPLTMGLFYALCVTTAALAVWSLISMIL
jgi:hypothetical protein